MQLGKIAERIMRNASSFRMQFERRPREILIADRADGPGRPPDRPPHRERAPASADRVQIWCLRAASIMQIGRGAPGPEAIGNSRAIHPRVTGNGFHRPSARIGDRDPVLRKRHREEPRAGPRPQGRSGAGRSARRRGAGRARGRFRGPGLGAASGEPRRSSFSRFLLLSIASIYYFFLQIKRGDRRGQLEEAS